MLVWLLILLALFSGLFYLLTGYDSALVSSGWERWGLMIGGVIMSIYAVLLLSGYQGRFMHGLRDIAIWLGIGLVLVIGYSFRDDLALIGNRVTSELAPPGQGVNVSSGNSGPIAIRIRRRFDDHFTARGTIDGTAVLFLVDTGASTVVLKPADAARAGIDTSRLSYTVVVQTANGTAFTAPVRLKSVAIGPIRVNDVEALVAKPGSLNENLLGMSFLRRLRSYEFSGNFLTLRQ